jgi:hypothetical protein
MRYAGVGPVIRVADAATQTFSADYNRQISFDNFAPVGQQPYVAYTDTSPDGKATVMKFDFGIFGRVPIGITGFSADRAENVSIATNILMPYVAFSDFANSGKITVMKFGSFVNKDVACSVTVPAERPNYNEVCTSDPNSCGDVNTGTYNICLQDGTM